MRGFQDPFVKGGPGPARAPSVRRVLPRIWPCWPSWETGLGPGYLSSVRGVLSWDLLGRCCLSKQFRTRASFPGRFERVDVREPGLAGSGPALASVRRVGRVAPLANAENAAQRATGKALTFCVNVQVRRPCGLMDKALVLGTKDCRFESCQGQCCRQFPTV